MYNIMIYNNHYTRLPVGQRTDISDDGVCVVRKYILSTPQASAAYYRN